MITAPFNFVPLSEKVFFPDWAEDVSHDVPFEDSQSGVIDITITAKSPIFIRNHENPEKFCQHDEQYYIPGSSVKGMIRNVLEIMSFSKMNFINDTTYAIRDLKYDKYMEKIKKGIHCGWLYKDALGEYKIEDCGEPYRVKYDEIDKEFTTNFKQNFMEGTFNNAKSPYKKAYRKYNLIPGNLHDTTYAFSEPITDKTGRKVVTFDPKGSNKGKLVLTGHPSARNENKKVPSGKIFDFAFITRHQPIILDVSKKVFDNFKFAYFDGRKTQPKESEDWSFWKKRLESSKPIPIFFHKTGEQVSSFGLSYLYKLPYDKSIVDVLEKEHTRNELDLAETIFGVSRKIESEQVSLKGRVQFSHGVKKENTMMEEDTPRNVLLGTPKASYYPIYLVQDGGDHKTLMDFGAELSGWKRYPIHRSFNYEDEMNSTQTTKITPLKSEATFSLKVKVHNLKKVELGALLSALSFHENNDCYHSLGMAKALGYGKVKLDIDALDGFDFEIEEYLKVFEASMNAEVFEDNIEWHNSEQIKNLFSMASEQNNGGDSALKYMDEIRNFAKAKNSNDYLRRYIEFEEDEIEVKFADNLCTTNDIEAYHMSIQTFVTRNNIRKAWNKSKKFNNLESYEAFLIEHSDSEYSNIAKEKIEELQDKAKKILEKEAQKEAKAKWEAVKEKLNETYYKTALENFISNYGDTMFVVEAKKELKKLSPKINTQKAKANNLGSIFFNANNVGDLNNIVNSNKSTDLNIKALEEAIVRIYKDTKNSKKDKFVNNLKKKKKIIEWLGSERIDDIILLINKDESKL